MAIISNTHRVTAQPNVCLVARGANPELGDQARVARTNFLGPLPNLPVVPLDPIISEPRSEK